LGISYEYDIQPKETSYTDYTENPKGLHYYALQRRNYLILKLFFGRDMFSLITRQYQENQIFIQFELLKSAFDTKFNSNLRSFINKNLLQPHKYYYDFWEVNFRLYFLFKSMSYDFIRKEDKITKAIFPNSSIGFIPYIGFGYNSCTYQSSDTFSKKFTFLFGIVFSQYPLF